MKIIYNEDSHGHVIVLCHPSIEAYEHFNGLTICIGGDRFHLYMEQHVAAEAVNAIFKNDNVDLRPFQRRRNEPETAGPIIKTLEGYL